MLQLAGVALLMFLFTDVFLTVFHAQGHAGPLSRAQNRVVWRVFRAAGIRSNGEPRTGVLAMAAPAMIVTTLATWVVLLVAGFALIYLPRMDTFLFSPGALRTPWLEAVYYSAYTAATLGLGDMVADLESLRILTAVEAFAGFALLSVSVTYMLAVYRELLAMKTLASEIAGYVRPGVAYVRSFARSEGRDAVARWMESVTSALMHVMQAHFQYPVLHYFRPQEADSALPLQLTALRDLSATGGKSESGEKDPADHPSWRALQDATGVYLRTVEDVFIPRTFEPRGADSDQERAHRRLLAYMVYAAPSRGSSWSGRANEEP